MEQGISVSYTHLRAHETDTSLFVGSVQMCIRDRCQNYLNIDAPIALAIIVTFARSYFEIISGHGAGYLCLLYTSPSPRDGHLSIRRQRPDVYKRQVSKLFKH